MNTNNCPSPNNAGQTKGAPTRARREALPQDAQEVARFIDTLKLRSLAENTQSEYLRYIRKLATRTGRDPAALTEEELRMYIVSLQTDSHYAASTLRTAVAAFHCFYNTHLGHEWLVFSLIRCPDHKNLPEVLTVEEVQRLLACIRLPRFRVLFGLIYACGLRLNEALTLEVDDIRSAGAQGAYLHLRATQTKGKKARVVPLPSGTLYELRAFWKTHRHPRFILFHRRPQAGTRSVTPFASLRGHACGVTISALPRSVPSLGCGWRDGPATQATLAQATAPMQDGAAQICMRNARAAAGLSERVTAHTLRHSYATHLLEKGVSLRLISAYMGHASLDITAIYLHLTAVNEAQARAAIESLQPKLPPLVF